VVQKLSLTATLTSLGQERHGTQMVSVFFSYSHRDEDYRNELETHLAILKRQGIISTWHDHRIGAGDDVDVDVSEHLEAAHIILLLVSPYFLESEYCYDREMKRALERHAAGEATVIPVIVHPCDWKNSAFGRLRATPPDGKPISKFPNMHDAYFAIVTDIRTAAEKRTSKALVDSPPAPTVPLSQPSIKPELRSSNLRVKKQFTDKEMDDFLDSSFEFIANYFENSLQELQDRNPGSDTQFKRVDQTHFGASVYVDGARRTACRVWLEGRGNVLKGIDYSENETGPDNSFNEALNAADDGYSLLLKPLGMAVLAHSPGHLLTQQGGAEYLWSIFILPLQ
jgi:hypothetical protein